jgi:hypothetical protein
VRVRFPPLVLNDGRSPSIFVSYYFYFCWQPFIFFIPKNLTDFIREAALTSNFGLKTTFTRFIPEALHRIQTTGSSFSF